MLAAYPAGRRPRPPPPASSIRSSCPGSVPPALVPVPARPRAGAGGAGPHRRPGSAADHRPGNGRRRGAGPRRRPCSRRRGTQSCGLELRRVPHGLVPARRGPFGNLARARLDPRSSRHFCGRRGAGPARRSGRAESGTAPPCMRWRGRARPRRPGWPVAWSSPSAARRPPGPGTRARGRSPGSSRVPGVAPGWCPFPAVKALLLPPQAPRKTLQPAISCFSAIHGRTPQKAGSYPHFTAVIHGFIHSLPTGYRV